MTRIALMTASTLALTLSATGCETGGENPNFGAYLVEAGQCEGNSYDKDLDTASPDPMDVWAEADGRDILLHLDNLDANCCPSPDATITFDGTNILVEFEDVTSGEPCDCTCITDFLVTIEDLDAGSYTLEVDYMGGSIGSAEVEISP